jgi:hypothetical protein
VALGYCQLLSLAARDLTRLFETEPALRKQINAVAQARIATAAVSGEAQLASTALAASSGPGTGDVRETTT